MSSNLALLQGLTDNPAARAWFRGLFACVQLEVTDTGEQFTVLSSGDRAEVRPGFEGDRPNFVVAITSEQVAGLASAFADGVASPDEEFRIVRHMLRPCLMAALEMPILNNDMVRKLARVDTFWQEALVDPAGHEVEQLTVTREHGKWVVTPGYHGEPQRRLRLTVPEALEFQRRLFKANEQNSLSGWIDLATWYAGWRDTVTVPAD
jgi:hypothetical protein